MTRARYSTAEAFRQALEARLAKRAAELSQNIPRCRQRCVFERFLARVFTHFGDRAVLKGGVALELRLAQARMTRDLDLTLHGRPGDLLLDLRRAGSLDLGDFLAFEVDPDPKHPTIEGEGIVYEGLRFRTQARLAGKVYADPFGLDIAFGDRMLVAPETRTSDDFLAFAGLSPTTLRIYAREVHLAEKLHAFTMPRPRENSRLKDLPDIALLGTTGDYQSKLLRDAIGATFEHRATHPVPAALPAPPESWTRPYERMARENQLPWPTLDDVFDRASAFLNPVLRGEDGTWDPAAWSWRA